MGGDDLDWMEQVAKERGLPVPDIIQKRVLLRTDLLFYWNAYFDLIDAPWSECNQYAKCYGVSIDLLWRILIRMRAARGTRG